MKAWTRRDLTIVPLDGAQDCIVIACDSCGGVGLKEGDVFRLPPRYTAKFTARVALTEVICSGALPVAVANGVSSEMHPTGEETVLGIKDELKNASLTDIVLTGSTEENFAASMTALAITVIGTAKLSELRFKNAIDGDKLVLLGSPKAGTEVDLESAGFYLEIAWLLSMPEVKEIVPVGSKGVAYEAETLSALSGMSFKPYETEIDYFKSAGPATCLLVLCSEAAADKIIKNYPTATVIGKMQ